jgi:signal transduction histidine kinase
MGTVLLTMRLMHESTARPLVDCPAAALVILVAVLSSAPALAADSGVAATPGSVGPWIFASVALLVVAVASYLAGARRPPGTGSASGSAHAATGPGAQEATRSTRPGALDSNSPAMPTLPAAAAAGHANRAGPGAGTDDVLRRLMTSIGNDPRPVLLLALDPQSGERLLAHANAAALRQLGAGPEALGQAWAAVEEAAPAALRTALLEPGNTGGWWLLREEAGNLCLALGPDGGTADADTASLVYTVSHDLRAPIRVVEGFTRIVKEDYGRQLDRVGNDHLDRVLAAGARMNQMIDAVLTMARLASQPLARQPVDLSQLAAFVMDDLRRGGPERHVEVLIEPGLRARGDPTLLRLVLENLLGNAWKYSAQVSRARIEFGAATADGQRVFAVRDNGAGFDMRVADRLFGLFQRLHSAKDFPGTGVGLASVRRIVQRHGGDVWAESEPGRGAAFFFTLRD